MADVAMLVLVVGCFLLTAGYARLCARLLLSPPGDEDVGP